MTGFFAQITSWINVPMNFLARILMAPLADMPPWLSNAVISTLIGLLMLIMFKYTSNQDAIGKIKDYIKANMLVLKLFKDDITVTMQALGRLFKGAFQMLFHALRPMAVMIIPISLIVSQMALWYQFRPLQTGEQALVTMQLSGEADAPWPQVTMDTNGAAEITTEKTRVFANRQFCWMITAKQPGLNHLTFNVDSQQVEKELAVGEGFMRVSAQRPGQNFENVFMHPAERPFKADSPVKSITIEYPEKDGQLWGVPLWIVYFLVISMASFLVFKPIFKVKI